MCQTIRAIVILGVTGTMVATSATASDYIRLIDSNPTPPLVTPDVRIARINSLAELFAKAGPVFNQVVVYRHLQQNFEVAFKQGMAEASRLGQRGVLLKVQVLSTPTDAGSYYSLRGDGAYLVGVGTNANDVCFSSKCYSNFQAAIPPGASLTPESSYMWVEKTADGKGYQLSKYQIGPMEDRASQVYFNSELRDAYRTAMTSSAISDYAAQLAKTVKARQDQERVLGLIKSRDDAIKKLSKVETDLARELKRAEAAAKTSATLNAIAGALSLASMVATINANMGENVTAGGGFSSKEEAISTMKAIEAQTGQRVQSLTVEKTSLRNDITGWEGSLLKIGVEFNMTPPSGSSLLPLP